MVHKLILIYENDRVFYDFDNTLAMDTRTSTILLKLALSFSSFPFIFSVINFFRTYFMIPNPLFLNIQDDITILTGRHDYDRTSIDFFIKKHFKFSVALLITRSDLATTEVQHKQKYLKDFKVNTYYEDSHIIISYLHEQGFLRSFETME